MSHLNRFYELKANNQDSLVSFDCLLIDYEMANIGSSFFRLTICSKDRIFGNVYANDFGFTVGHFDNATEYYLSFDGANFTAKEEEIAIDVVGLEIMIVYGLEK